MNRSFKSLSALADHLNRVAAALPGARARALDQIGQAVERNARDRLGKQQSGWAPLAASTLADKARRGLPSPSPLLRTGAHIANTVGHSVSGHTVIIGARDQVAAYQELGTSRIPARPFLGPAMIETRREQRAIILGQVMLAFRRS